MARPLDPRAQRELVKADEARRAGKLAEAERSLRALLKREPRAALAWTVLAKTLAAKGDPEVAEATYARAVALDPDALEARVNLGVSLAGRGAAQEAVVHLRAAARLAPTHALVLRNLGGVLRTAGALEEAVGVLERAIALDVADPGAYTNLGLALSSLGRHAEALPHLERAVALGSHEPLYHDNLLMLMHYDDTCSAEAIAAAHRRYGAIVEARTPRLPAVVPGPLEGRPLRVGLVSADLHRHSVAFFLESLLGYAGRASSELFAYSASRVADAVTARIRPFFREFREIVALDDAAAAALVRADAIDVLVDLGGHTQGNRLGVFARRPAPVQMTYLGYPNTTGLTTIDYRISDAWSDPPGRADAWHTERLLRLPSGFLCYRPPEDSPEVAPAPSTLGHPPTFGSFNALAKLSERTLALWGRLLRETPEARLLVKQSFLSDAESRASFERRLAQHGFPRERVELLGHVAGLDAHLAAYARVDVALDSFPYHGTTTTCDALWMGVPVVTLAGEAHVSRVGVSLLSRMGAQAQIAADDDAYVAGARALLRDEAQRVTMRAQARARLVEAGIVGGDRVAATFFDALRGAWEASVGGGSG
jgi:predicted O-linked N-acetylglucosamine transferase (SPINDLY family)